MENAVVLKWLGLLFVLPWALPVLRMVVREVWEVADPNPKLDDPEVKAAQAERAALWDSGPLDSGQVSNGPWETGRPRVRRQPTGFRGRRR